MMKMILKKFRFWKISRGLFHHKAVFLQIERFIDPLNMENYNKALFQVVLMCSLMNIIA